MVYDPRRLARSLLSEWNATEQPIQERGNVFPLGIYEDGSAHLAWPGLIHDGVQGANALMNQSAYLNDHPELMSDPEFIKSMSGNSLMAAGLAATGGAAAGVAGGLPDNALASNAVRMGDNALPMDQASRLARAKEMGFDTDRVLYHGTGADFDEFKPGTRGNGTARNIYLTDNPDIADIYANSQNYGLRGGGDPMIYPLFAKSEKPLIVSDKGPDGSFGWVSDNLAAALGVDHPPPGKYSSLYDEARRQGYDQVQIREMTDLGGQQTQYIPLDPRNIRSVNAAFDPSKADSANLLAANPKTAPLVPTAINTDDDETYLNALLQRYGGQ